MALLLVSTPSTPPSSASAPAATSGATSIASQPTNRGSNARTGWYPDQPGLSPSVVAGSRFGQIFNTPVVGQVFAQPLVASGVLVVATMQDWVYGLNPSTGEVEWSRQIAQPFYQVNAWTLKGESCGDVGPYVGVLSTPTVDPVSGIVYMLDMQQGVTGTPSYWMQALNPLTGEEEPNFPVRISGSAQNDPGLSFNANLELQRPGLLLLNGRVYAAFSSHCDQSPFYGFVVGVNTTGTISTIWTDVISNHVGGGIWQSGGGLVQYGNDILLTSGNGYQSPAGPLAGTQPPTSLGESVINLSVTSTGALVPVDFFTPYDAAYLDKHDFDFGTGAPVLLPSSFGTASVPNVVVQESKGGYVYLLNADNLGGVGNGPGGGDNSLATVGPYGGVWATPAAYPTKTGGFLYMPTATGGTGSLGNAHQGNFDVYQVNATGATPTLTQVATAGSAASGSTAFGYGAASPVVTSNQMVPNTGVVWVVRSSDGLGDDATLQAYNATPSGRWLTLINQWPIGLANKFTSPGVWANKIYAVSQDGHVIGFGVKDGAQLSGRGLNFSTTVIGHQSLSKSLTVTADHALTISSVQIASNAGTASPAQFSIVGVHPAVTGNGLHLAKGATATISVAFAPSASPGAVQSTVRVVFDSGELDLPLTGLAESPTALLYGSTTGLDFGGVTIGTSSTQTMHFTNFGAEPFTWGSSVLPSNGFSLGAVPTPGTSLAPGASISVPVTYTPNSSQSVATSSFTFTTSDASTPQTWTVNLSAHGAQPSQLSLSTSSGGSALDLGSVPVGGSSTGSFTITNSGGSTATLARVRAPSSSAFIFSQTLNTGDQIQAGSSLTINVAFQPDATGPQSAAWQFTTNAPGAPTYTIAISGTASGAGFALPVLSTRAGWTTNGSASITDQQLTLTQLRQFQAGSAYWPVAIASATMTFSYVVNESLGDGADATALVLADAATTSPSSVGSNGSGLAFDNVQGIGVVIGTYPEPGSPPTLTPKGAGYGWIGITNGWNAQTDQYNWIGGVNLPAELGGVQNDPLGVTVSVADGALSVFVNGTNELTQPVTLPPSLFVGFAGSTGSLFNRNVVSDLRATIAGTAPSSSLRAPSSLSVKPQSVGGVSFTTLSLSNEGSSPLAIVSATTSNPAFFVTGTTFPIEIAPAGSIKIRVGFQPASPGDLKARLLLNTPGAASTPVALHARATGSASVVAPLHQWRRNGPARLVGSTLNLTSLATFQASSSWSRSLSSSPTAAVTFTPLVSPGNGADGIAVLFGSANVPDTTLGSNGWGLGFAPVVAPSYAVVFSEDKEHGAPGANFVGISDGGANGSLHWLATAVLHQPLSSISSPVSVTTSAHSITVWVNGVRVLTRNGLSVPSALRIGISGSNGGLVDYHAVVGLRATAP
ncbi:MAG: Ig-like domain-containing protein [Acidimicrobiales bacterium]